jgi:ElaB/YqjD/DUF883 family membrane-anchored ribosome-binding protein
MGEKTDLTLRRENVSVSDYDSKTPEEIRDDIKKTRASISHTVDLLQERLDPDRLKGEAQDKVREATIGRLNSMADDMGRKAKRARYTVMETIKDNPVPAALVGLGLGWLLVEGFSQSSRPRYEEDYWVEDRYYPVGERAYTGGLYEYEVEPYEVGDEYRSRSRVRESFDQARARGEYAVDRARDRAEDLGHEAREKVSEMGQQAREQVQNISDQARAQAENLGSQVKEQAEYLSDEARHQMEYMRNQARYQARRAKSQFNTMLDENPLAVGAAALALGVALGLSVPETRYEDEYFGPMRDDLLDKAQDKAEEVMDKVEHVARETVDSASKTAKKETEREMGKSSFGSTTPGSSST